MATKPGKKRFTLARWFKVYKTVDIQANSIQEAAVILADMKIHEFTGDDLDIEALDEVGVWSC